jgi:2-keto-3-deoxy-L-rhamnonate aldolase RhmA
MCASWDSLLGECCRLIASRIALIVRLSTIIVVPSNCSDWITRLLDNGAQGIIVSPRRGHS